MSISFVGALAEAFQKALAQNLDLGRMGELLEVTRRIASDGVGAIESLGEMTGVIAANVGSPALAKILNSMRQHVIEAKIQSELARFRQMATENPQLAERAWIETIGHAMATFYFDVAEQFARGDLGVEPSNRAEMVERITEAQRGQWRDCALLYDSLGRDDRLSNEVRAGLLAILAEIEAALRDDLPAASVALKEAEALAPEGWRVAFTRGRLIECQRDPVDFEAAADAFRRAAELSARRAAMPLVQLGNRRRDDDDVAGAELLYAEASRCAFHPEEGYNALIELAGLPGLYPVRKELIEGLIDKASLVGANRSERCISALAAADAARANLDADAFSRWIDLAIASDPQNYQAYLQRGYAALEKVDFEATEADFKRVTALAPQAPDGWWGMANLANDREDWVKLLDCGRETLKRAPDWSAAVTTLIENAAEKVRSYDEALALKLYDGLHEALGSVYDAAFHNNVGNLHYYHLRFDEAVACFRNAIAAEPQSARYHANLAIGLEQTARSDPAAAYAEALDLARMASAFEPADAEFQALVGRLSCRNAFVDRFGPAATALTPDVEHIRVFMGRSLLAHVAAEEQLLPRTTERIGALRDELALSSGFMLPGIRFSPLDPTSSSCDLVIEIAGEAIYETALPFAADALQHVEAAIRHALPRALGHRETRDVAERCGGDAAGQATEPIRLNDLTAWGRTVLARGERLDCSALLEAPAAPPPAPPSAHIASPPSKIEIRWDTEAATDANFGVRLQELLFVRSGVLIPIVAPQAQGALPAGHAEAAIDGTVIGGPVPATAEALSEALAANAGRLLDPLAVQFHLLDLEEHRPVLVEVARAVLPGDDIVVGLRARLAEGQPIRHLPGALEAILLSRARL